MERRKDKNNRVLKDGESYREKEHRYMYRWIDGDKKQPAPMHRRCANCVRRKRKSTAIKVTASVAQEATCVWMTCISCGKRTRSV